jgi:chromatin remodeling complex protein RSC6
MQPSSDLAAVVGSSPMPRTEVTKKLWQYIKRKGLQDSKNRRMINADENLRPIFRRDQVSMFEMTKLVNRHLS